MEKNDIFTIKIEDMSDDGMGIGHIDGMAVFVKDTAPGDEAEIKIVKVKKSYAFGRLRQILKPSPYRIDPVCPVARQCGGCTLQHISYEKELELKKDRVINCLKRIGGIEKPEDYLDEVSGGEAYRYRNKMQFPVGSRKTSDIYGGRNDNFDAFSCRTNTVLGFYAGRTHTLIPVDDCHIGHPINKNIIRAVCRWADKYQISVYNEETGEGTLRHILTRVGFATGELMVCVITSTQRVDNLDKLVSMLASEVDKYNSREDKTEEILLKSVVMNVNRDRTNRILGDKTILVNGQNYITDLIGDVKFHISAESFYQVNPEQTAKIYGKALEYAALSGKEIVWDMYCGIGTISLFVAPHAKKVYGVEVVGRAIQDAHRNAEINDIENAEFFVGKAEEVVPDWFENRVGDYDTDEAKIRKQVDVVIVDPPRKGCDERLLETIIEMKPEKMVYVSCDPATLARDIKRLTEKGMKLEKFSVYDQFSRSMHCETVALLKR